MNTYYKKLRILLAILTDDNDLDGLISEALTKANTPISKSKIHGWTVSQGTKNYRRQSSDEFNSVLAALIGYFRELYRPNLLKEAIPDNFYRNQQFPIGSMIRGDAIKVTFAAGMHPVSTIFFEDQFYQDKVTIKEMIESIGDHEMFAVMVNQNDCCVEFRRLYSEQRITICTNMIAETFELKSGEVGQYILYNGNHYFN